MPRNPLRTTQEKIPEIDLEEFKLLYRTMYVVFGSQAKAARVMQISYPTYRRWENNPPTWPYYNLVMEAIIKARLRGFKIGRRGFTSQQHYRITQLLGKLDSMKDLLEDIEHDADHIHEVMDFLRSKLSVKGIYFDQLILPKHSSGYGARSLQRAARALGVVREQEGYGEEKRSYWKLPTVATDEDADDRASTRKSSKRRL